MNSPVLLAVVIPWLSAWLTPVWLLAVGTTLGLLVLLLLWGLLALVHRRAAASIPLAVAEGPLLPLAAVLVVLAIFVLAAATAVPSPQHLLATLTRLPAVGERRYEFPLAAPTHGAADAPESPREIPVTFRRAELQRLELDSDGRVIVSAVSDRYSRRIGLFDVKAGEKALWVQGEQAISPFPEPKIDRLYVWNESGGPVVLKVRTVTDLVYPQFRAIPLAAAAVVGLFLLYLIPRVLAPKLSAIALATTKSEMAQPLFAIVLALGIFLVLMLLILPYNTFGEDIKMYKDSGLTLIMVLAIIMALWAGGTSVAEEIEGRTALTVLSKPIGRRQFILGKFVGISWAVGVVFIILGLWFLVWVAYKPIYDARESANLDPTWQASYAEMAGIVPGLILAFFETVVFVALSVAISTRLPILANFVICFTIYALGHLTPLLVKSTAGNFPVVTFMAQLLATVLPVLEQFNVQPAIAAGRNVPYEYLATSLVYCLLYSTVAMLLALAMFEDRDLA